MWLVKPEHMCKNHLLGEHVEIHMLVGCLEKGKNIKGYLKKGLVDPSLIEKRHDELVSEMKRRGYRHLSPLDGMPRNLPVGNVNQVKNASELASRCTKCRALNIDAHPLP